MSTTTIAALHSPTQIQPQRPTETYNVSIGYLRAFITLLVLAHHAVLAYHPFAPAPGSSLNGPARAWGAFPVVDSQRWMGFSLFVGFNDIFFMALMFFLSGLFVWKSLQRKGSGQFLRDRALRLGLPFLFAAAVLAPIAYYPAYLQTGAHGIAGFWQQWKSLGNWPAGPAWFVWVLLTFDGIATTLFLLMPRLGDALGKLASTGRRPIVFFGILIALSAVAYIPLELKFNAFSWSSFGPFIFQTSRILHYFVYFILGVGVGVCGFGQGLLASDGKLARRWWIWSIAALVSFIIISGVVLVTMTAHLGSRAWEIASAATFVLSCAASSFAFLALFVRFAHKRRKIFDSLSNNAYGMYLIHYAIVSWLQYALLPASLPAVVKGLLVTAGTVLLSWATTAALRRIPAVARVI